MGRAIQFAGLLILLAGCETRVSTDVPARGTSVVWLTYDESDILTYPEVGLLKIYLALLQSPLPELASAADSALDTFPVERVLEWAEEKARATGKSLDLTVQPRLLVEDGSCAVGRVKGSGLLAIHWLSACVKGARIHPWIFPGPTTPGEYSAEVKYVVDILSFIPFGEIGTFELSMHANTLSYNGGGNIPVSKDTTFSDPLWCVNLPGLVTLTLFFRSLPRGLTPEIIVSIPEDFPVDRIPDPGDYCGYYGEISEDTSGYWIVGGPGWAGWARTQFSVDGAYVLPPHGFTRNCDVALEMDESGTISLSRGCD